MNIPMRLYRRPNGTYYVEFRRGVAKSLKTADQKEAEKIFKEIRKEWLSGRLRKLDQESRITLGQWKERFLKTRIGLAEKTITKYELSLRLLGEVIGTTTCLSIIKQDHIDAFKQACLMRGVTPQGINSYLRHIKAALREAHEHDPQYIKRMPKIKMVPVDEALPRVLMPGEIDKLFTVAQDYDCEISRLVTFLLWTGCRRKEAVNLQWSDCNLDQHPPTCTFRRTKGKKDRRVPLLPYVLKAIGAKKNLGPVFKQIHPDTLTHEFQKIASIAGIKTRLHDLRHTAATYMLHSGIDIQMVRDILGHANISTTMIYTHVIREKMYKEMSKLRFE